MKATLSPSTVEPDLAHTGCTPRKFRARNLHHAGRHWVRGDACATAFFNALSAVFPVGEAFMIEALKPWRDRVPEPLASDVAAFIVQEAAHTREHGTMNKALIASGYDMVPLERAIKGFVSTFADAGDITKLGATMCIEHLTAIVAAELLHRPHHLQGSDPEMQKLWFWHGIEEIEHKAVAFDTWMYATRQWSAMRRWTVRSALMVAVSISFFINRTRGQVELMRQDGTGWKKALPMLLQQGFAKDGIGRAVLKPWFHFLKPGFHPWQIDDRHLVAKGEAILKALQIITEGQPQPAADLSTQSTARRVQAA